MQLKAKKVDEFSDDVEKGKVIGLRPAEGTAPRDSEVEVLVSKGPDLVEVPPVQGKSLDEAVAAIEARRARRRRRVRTRQGPALRDRTRRPAPR